MAPIAQQIAQMVEILPEADQALAFEVVKKLVLAWDPDYTKATQPSIRQWSRQSKSWTPGNMSRTAPSIGTEIKAEKPPRCCEHRDGQSTNTRTVNHGTSAPIIISEKRRGVKSERSTSWQKSQQRAAGPSGKRPSPAMGKSIPTGRPG